jgi:WD40 repeat protein
VVSYKALGELVDLGVNINQNRLFSQTDLDVLQGTERLKTPGSFVVTTSRDKTIMLWDASSGQHLRTFVSI